MLFLSIVATGAQAQVAGWTIESIVDAESPATYKAMATRSVGPSKLILEHSMLGGVSYRIDHEGCSSSSGGAGSDIDPVKRREEIRVAMTGLVRDKDNFCKLPPAAVKGLVIGLPEAIAAVETAYERDRPTITVTARSATRDGWSLEDTPGEAIDGLVSDHIFRMRKASGPILLTYTNTLPLSSDKVSAGSRSIEGKVRDCDYGDSDSSEFISAAARAGAVRKQIASGLETTGCEATPAQIAAALAGFDAAYTMLDSWASERLDERRMLLQAAGSSDALVMTSDSPMMSEDAAMSAECAIASASGDTPPKGC